MTTASVIAPIIVFTLSVTVLGGQHSGNSIPKIAGNNNRTAQEAQPVDNDPDKLHQVFGVGADELKDWMKAIQSLHSGAEASEPVHLNELFDVLTQLSEEKINEALQDLESGGKTAGLRKALEVFRKLNHQKLEELEEKLAESDPVTSRAAKEILERKKSEQDLLERADQIRKGISLLDEKFSKEKPSREEMGAIADARAKQRAEIGKALEKENLHPDSQKALKAYLDALELEKARVLKPQQRAAIERETPSYWSHLGSGLKSAYLSLEGAHLGLQAAGLVPVMGEAADLLDAALYAAEGKKGEAALSFAAVVPVAGVAVTAGRKTVKASQSVAETVGGARSLARSASKSLDYRTGAGSEVGRELVRRAHSPSAGDAAEFVRIDNAPPYQVNPKHVRGTPAYREARSASVIPEDHVDLYRSAKRAKNGDYWAMDSNGNYHRFKHGHGTVHWSGSTLLKKRGKPGSKPPTRDNPDPINFKDVPDEVL